MRNRIQIGVVSICVLTSLTAPVWAAPPYVSPDDKIPSLDLAADSLSIVTFPSGVQLRNLELQNPSNQVSAGSGNFNVSSFFDVFVEISLDNGGSWQPHQGTGSGTIHVDPVQPSGPLSIYDTEMLQLDIFGGNLPAGVIIRESPTQPSNGTTTIQPIGGGLYHIDSFFDVFVELSLDGGQNWTPASSPPVSLNGTPEPTTVAMLALGGLLVHRRRRRTA